MEPSFNNTFSPSIVSHRPKEIIITKNHTAMKANYGSFEDSYVDRSDAFFDDSGVQFSSCLKKSSSLYSLLNNRENLNESSDNWNCRQGEGDKRQYRRLSLETEDTLRSLICPPSIRALELDLDFISKSYGRVQQLAQSQSPESVKQFDVTVEVHPLPPENGYGDEGTLKTANVKDGCLCPHPKARDYTEPNLISVCDGPKFECISSVIRDSHECVSLNCKRYHVNLEELQAADCLTAQVLPGKTKEICFNISDKIETSASRANRRTIVQRSNNNKAITTQNSKLISLSLSLLVAALLQVVRCLTLMLDDTLSCFRQDMF